MLMMQYRVVQPYGVRRDEWTVQSEHATVADAFAEIDRLSAQMRVPGRRATL